MSFRQAIFAGSLLLLLLLTGAPNSLAQTDPQEPQESPDAPPKPAARSTPLPPIDSGQDDTQDINQLQPDTTPLTGVANASLGTSELRHSYWVPGIQYASNIQSGQYGQSSSGWLVNNYLMANLSLLKAWSRSQLSLNYSGGGVFSSDSQIGNGYTQQMAVSQSFQWNRFQLQFLDQFYYLPQQQFGFGSGTSLGVPGVGGGTGPSVPTIGGGVAPNQSIFTATGPSYNNTFVVQTNYQLTPRTSITASGSYGILRFVDPGNVDSAAAMGSLGYNYQLTKADTLGVLYRFTGYQYSGEPQAYGSHIVSLAYGRKITGRLAFQAYGGPQYTTYRIPIGNQTSSLGGNGSFNLTYGFENGSLTGGFFHGLGGGSGVLVGSNISQISLSATRKLSRIWTGQMNFGYARNTPVASATPTTAVAYDSWIGGGGVSRPFGRDINFSAAYSVNISKSDQSGCTGASCTTTQTVNYITLSFQWHTRPFVLP
jgi:hypothetical protein